VVLVHNASVPMTVFFLIKKILGLLTLFARLYSENPRPVLLEFREAGACLPKSKLGLASPEARQLFVRLRPHPRTCRGALKRD
jgi:hypothetical protein